MKHIDPKLGVPLPEKDYGGNCRLYDYDNPQDPFHNIWVESVPLLSSSDAIYEGLKLNFVMFPTG